jgi:NAD-dependent SIR2 family protein deacetylase
MSIHDLGKMIKSGDYKNIIVLTGAGISTSAGLSDYRSCGSFVQQILEEYGFSDPEEAFDKREFMRNPEPMYKMLKQLCFPVIEHQPTPAHYFIKKLADNGMLLKWITQNIDGLELKTGLDSNFIIQVHGSCNLFRCVYCDEEYTPEQIKEKLDDQTVVALCDECVFNGPLKPDIVMYGEKLDDEVLEMIGDNLSKCDLLLVIGTSLSVHPVSSIPSLVNSGVPCVLINRERVNVWEKDFSDTKLFVGGDIDESLMELDRILFDGKDE